MFFPTGTFDSIMLEWNKTGLDITSGNLLCYNVFIGTEGNIVHCGKFVYNNNNDPNEQYIRGLFYLARPVTASVNNRNCIGYVKQGNSM